MKQKKPINANRHKANFTQKQLAKRKRERKEKVSQPVQTDHQSHYSCSPKYKLFVLLVARATNTQNNHKKEKAIAKQQNSDTPLSIASLSRGARLFNPPEPSPAQLIPSRMSLPLPNSHFRPRVREVPRSFH
ncbi:hypothetical protein J3E69DRAFT_216524 [Trichoderma sp. SZMC 28015]